MIKKYISKEKIQSKVKQLVKKVYKDYKKEKKLNLIIVLTGAKYFAKDFIREIKKIGIKKINKQFIRAESYAGTKSTGKISIKKDSKKSIAKKNVLIIEDIVDTGLTLFFLKKYLLNKKKAKSVRICSFLDKPSRREKNIKIDYIGFKVPNKFIVGYGLDYNEKYRGLKYIGVLVENKK